MKYLIKMNAFSFALVIFFGGHLLVGTVAKFIYWPSFTNETISSASDTRQAIAASHMGEVESEQTGEMPLWIPYLFSGMPGFPLVTTGVPRVHPLPVYLGWMVGRSLQLLLYRHTLLFDLMILSVIFIVARKNDLRHLSRT